MKWLYNKAGIIKITPHDLVVATISHSHNGGMNTITGLTSTMATRYNTIKEGDISGNTEYRQKITIRTDYNWDSWANPQWV
jgi:glutamate synthase domain-containing protein 1